MKSRTRFALLTGIMFLIVLTMFTFIYSVRPPSITTIRVTEYGFPYTWLKISIETGVTANMQSGILFPGILYDFATYLLISAILAYVLNMRFPIFIDRKARFIGTVAGIVAMAYASRLLAGLINEVLGQYLWAVALGAREITFGLYWSGFGYTQWSSGISQYNSAVVYTAGIIIPMAIGWFLILYLYFTRGRTFRRRYLRIPLYWTGFWLVTVQSGYLMIGGLTGFGDVGSMHDTLGIPLDSFLLIGFLLFVLNYIASSILFLSEISYILAKFSQRFQLTLFWLLVPVVLITFNLTYNFDISYSSYAVVVFMSYVPMLISIGGYGLLRELTGSSKTTTN